MARSVVDDTVGISVVAATVGAIELEVRTSVVSPSVDDEAVVLVVDEVESRSVDVT